MKYYHKQTLILFLSIIFLFPSLAQAQKLVQIGKNIEGGLEDQLGSSVSLSADGKTLATGADGRLGKGSLKVYTWNGTGWVQKGNTIENEEGYPGDGFGQTISLSADGNVLASGAGYCITTKEINDEGQVKVYAWNGTDWVQKGNAINGSTESHPSNRLAGNYISLSGDGNTLILDGKYMSIYVWNGESWIETWNKRVYFHEAVSISSDGKTVAMAGQFEDGSPYQVLILEWNGTDWIQKGSYISSNQESSAGFGTSLSLNANGENLVVGFPTIKTDYTMVYEWNGSDWVQKGKDISKTGEELGYAVSISADGNTMATGGREFVFVYAWNGSDWAMINKGIKSKSANLRAYTVSISADGSIIAVGSSLEKKTNTGIVRVFQLKD